MGTIFLAVTASLLVYVVAVALIPAHVLQGSGTYTRHMINRLREQNATSHGLHMSGGAGLQEDPADSPLVRAFLLIPLMQRAVPLIQKAGLWRKLDQFVLGFALVFLFFLLLFAKMGIFALFAAALTTWLLAYLFLKRGVKLRKRAFLDLFPEALDAIVRSVRSGYPLNSAIALVGDNTPAPVGPEFKRVADETAYGWSLFEALNRLADRIEEQDVRFFTIVLAVQQESGGNLSEVLSNLSNVLRKRRHMRMKILALSSEGRASAWVLGCLPVLMLAAVYYVAPRHLDPLFYSYEGHILMLVVATIMGFGFMIIRQIVRMDI